MDSWPAGEQAVAQSHPEGPRPFERFEATNSARWKLVPFAAQGGFDDWASIDEIFIAKFQGVNPNRGLEGSVVDFAHAALLARMTDYFSSLPSDRLQQRYPVLMQNRARHDAAEIRKKLRSKVQFSDSKIVPYVVFPLDQRWIYYEVEGKFLNEARSDLFNNLSANEFLITVPEPRKESETRPILLTTAFDLHLHDRGSVGFPVEVVLGGFDTTSLFGGDHKPETREANIAPRAWQTLKTGWGLRRAGHQWHIT